VRYRSRRLPSNEAESTPSTEPAAELEIEARTRDLGNGLDVQLLLPSAARRMVGPFIFLDHTGAGAARGRTGARRTAASSDQPGDGELARAW